MNDMDDNGRSGASAPSGSQASPGAAVASPPSVSIPNAHPAYMEWPELRTRMWDRLKVDDEREEDDLVATAAELGAVLAWADLFNRQAQPRRDEEQATYDMIRQAAALIENPGDDVTVFTFRIEGNRTKLHTRAGKSVNPREALCAAIDALKAELEEVEKCPVHAASAMSAGTAEPAAQSQGQRPASAVPEGETPNTNSQRSQG